MMHTRCRDALRGPSRRRSSVSCPAAERTQLHRARAGPDQHAGAFDDDFPGLRASPSTTFTGPSLIRTSPIMVHAPGFGVTARIRRSTACAGRSQRTCACSTVTLAATLTSVVALRHGMHRAVFDAVDRRLQQFGAGNGKAAEQIAGRVGRTDRLGDHAVQRPAVQARFDPKGCRTGHRVTGGDGGLHRRGPPPGRQQREVQIDPTACGYRQQLGSPAARQRPPRRSTRGPIGQVRRRTRRSWAATASTPRCRVRRPARATGEGAGLPRRPDTASGRVSTAITS